MTRSRRDFLKAASAAAVSLAGRGLPLGGGLAATPLPGLDAYPHAGEKDLEELAARALDAARAAGAGYADVRFTLRRVEQLRFLVVGSYSHDQDEELAGVGVRALVDGAWGFASSALWTPDELARLGREAAAQARTNARGRARRVELDIPPAPARAEWKMPVERDPFDVPLVERIEVPWALMEQANRYNLGARNATAGASMRTRWERQERTFASTEGAFLAQTLYYADPWFVVSVRIHPWSFGHRTSEVLRPCTGGWEILARAPVLEELPRLIEEAYLIAGAEAVVPDRYDVVLDAKVMTRLVGLTIGVAAELDRVLGLEANAGGTSYLPRPADMPAEFRLGPEILNVRANRSQPGALATVRWDDEGVEPDAYDVIRSGALVDYHTTRDLAGELRDWYAAQGQPVRSHGCASSEDARSVTLLHPPNLELAPATGTTTLEELAGTLEKGLVICGGGVTVDRQQLHGEINGEMVYEVRRGKRTRFVRNSEVLFRTPELWKGLKALGGAGTQYWAGVEAKKGEPAQTCRFSVGAVPGLFERVAVTDRMRKA